VLLRGENIVNQLEGMAENGFELSEAAIHKIGEAEARGARRRPPGPGRRPPAAPLRPPPFPRWRPSPRSRRAARSRRSRASPAPRPIGPRSPGCGTGMRGVGLGERPGSPATRVPRGPR
jgi:hypothetical protein